MWKIFSQNHILSTTGDARRKNLEKNWQQRAGPLTWALKSCNPSPGSKLKTGSVCFLRTAGQKVRTWYLIEENHQTRIHKPGPHRVLSRLMSDLTNFGFSWDEPRAKFQWVLPTLRSCTMPSGRSSSARTTGPGTQTWTIIPPENPDSANTSFNIGLKSQLVLGSYMVWPAKIVGFQFKLLRFGLKPGLI